MEYKKGSLKEMLGGTAAMNPNGPAKKGFDSIISSLTNVHGHVTEFTKGMETMGLI